MVYAIFSATISDKSALDAYRPKAGEALARHGGKVEQATPAPLALDGAPSLPDIAAVLSFPDVDSAQAWINDPDLVDLHKLRRSAGETSILLLT